MKEGHNDLEQVLDKFFFIVRFWVFFFFATRFDLLFNDCYFITLNKCFIYYSSNVQFSQLNLLVC